MNRYPRYPAYKPSGVSWEHEFPAHWKLKRGKYLFERMSRAIQDDDEVITAFRDGEVTLRSNRRTDGFTFSIKEIGYQGIRKGDLVIHQMDGFAGAIGVSDSDGKSSPVYSVCMPSSFSEADPYYFAYLLRFLAWNEFILSLAKGIRERSTSFGFREFGELSYPVPSIDEQKSIVAFLDGQTAVLDSLIQEKQALIGLLREKRAAVIGTAVTQGLDPTVPMKDSGVEWIGRIPAHWEVRRLSSVTHLQRGYDLTTAEREEGEVPVYSSSGLAGYHSIAMTKGPGVITGRYGTIGEIYYSETDFWAMNTSLFVKDFRGNHPRFAYYLLQTLPFKAFSGKSAVPGVDRKDLHQLEVCCPPVEQQTEIAIYLDEQLPKFEQAIAETEASIATLQEYRAALIATAVTGQIDVRELGVG